MSLSIGLLHVLPCPWAGAGDLLLVLMPPSGALWLDSPDYSCCGHRSHQPPSPWALFLFSGIGQWLTAVLESPSSFLTWQREIRTYTLKPEHPHGPTEARDPGVFVSPRPGVSCVPTLYHADLCSLHSARLIFWHRLAAR